MESYCTFYFYLRYAVISFYINQHHFFFLTAFKSLYTFMMFSEAYISRQNFKVKRQWLRLLVQIARDPIYSQLTSSTGIPTSLNLYEGEKSTISILALIYIFNSTKDCLLLTHWHLFFCDLLTEVLFFLLGLLHEDILQRDGSTEGFFPFAWGQSLTSPLFSCMISTKP